MIPSEGRLPILGQEVRFRHRPETVRETIRRPRRGRGESPAGEIRRWSRRLPRIVRVETLVLVLRLLVAGVFATAGVAKLRDPVGSRAALVDFGVPGWLTRPIGLILPLTEIVVAAGLVFPPSARWAAIAAILLLAAFVVAIADAMAHGRAPDCHCFGNLHSEPAGWSTLIRNGVLVALAAMVVVLGPGPSVSEWASERSGFELALIGAVVGAATVAGFLLQPSIQRHRVRRWERRAEKQRQDRSGPGGKPIGSYAPPFTVREVDTKTKVTLESLCSRGKPVVLVFVHPFCGPCLELMPELGEWQRALADRLTIVPISQGDRRHTLRLQRKHGIAEFLRQRRADVYNTYEVRGTPSAVVVGTHRKVASSTVIGGLEIEQLIRLTLHREESWSDSRLVA